MKKNIVLFTLILSNSLSYSQLKTGSNTKSISNNTYFEVESVNGNKTIITRDSGQVGIGNTTPLHRLVVRGLNKQPSALGTNRSNAIVRIEGESNHSIDFGTFANSPFGGYIQSYNKAATATLPLVLNPMAGNVGIWNTNPSAPLDVLSTSGEVARLTTTATGSTYGGIGIGNNSGVWTKLAAGEGKFQIRNFSTDTIVFHADLVTKNIGLGTTNPTQKLEVNSGTAGASGVRISQLSANINSTSTANTALLGINEAGVVVPVGSSKRMESIAANATFDVNINTFASYKITISGAEDAANGYKTFADEYLITYANNFTKLSVVQVAGVHSNLGAQTMKSAYSTSPATLTPDHGAYSANFSASGTSGVITTTALRGLAIIAVKTQSLW